MQNNNSKNLLQKRRAISPILATVVLLGITVVAGGLVYSVFSSSATAASSADVIAIQNAQAVKGTSHADVTVTVKNAGGQPWTKVEMTLSKSELSEPILYESLHENVVGCTASTYSASACKDGVDNAESGAAGNRDNPLRAQWLATLDKTGGEENKADPGEGISVGRKLVFESKDDYRTLTILNGTAVAPLFGGEDSSGSTTLSTKMTNLGISACNVATDTDCTTQFDALDPVSGNIFCSTVPSDDTVVATCRIFTHTSIEGEPISSGQSIFFYADAFTQEVPGLNNQVLRTGDNLVVNIATENADGGTARAQTIIKVTGV